MSILRRYGADESDFFGAELIFGELLANVVRHAPGPVEVSLDWNADVPVLSVHDEEKPFDPVFELPRNPLQESGRGLFLVKALAKSVVTCHVQNDGTKVIVTLPVRRRLPPSRRGLR